MRVEKIGIQNEQNRALTRFFSVFEALQRFFDRIEVFCTVTATTVKTQ